MPEALAAALANLGAVGLSLYLLWHIVTRTLPARDELFAAMLREQREACRHELGLERAAREETETRHLAHYKELVAERAELLARVVGGDDDRRGRSR